MIRDRALGATGVRHRRRWVQVVLYKAFAELRGDAEKTANDDPLIDELEKIVEFREAQLEGVRALRAAAAQGGEAVTLYQAEADMAQARVEVLKAKRAAVVDAAGVMLMAAVSEADA